jgi:hypothetical protein
MMEIKTETEQEESEKKGKSKDILQKYIPRDLFPTMKTNLISAPSKNSIITWGLSLEHMNLSGTFHIQTITFHPWL